ncbi:MAG: UDP-N-acetylglucosamine--LPS N-acetylglucosamine transferase [Desulfobacteraceae bacterium]|nr:MAG: UDP-N-acetylglucosamine--LPS N-acetylglucosamine transferase [Desulfobacteraceae bacterium]
MRILILSASVGAGHLRAAEAVELALRELAPEAIIRNIDVLQWTSKAFRRIYGRAYLDLVNKAPHVLGYFYDMLDQPPGPHRKSDRLRLLVERLNLGKVTRFLQAEKWDVIVNTHFLPAEIIAFLKRTERINVPQMTVTTDFETHRLWVANPCERYCTATEEGAVYLEYWGVPAQDIRVTGIPIHPVFSQSFDRVALLNKYGLTGNRPVLLQLAGGFGVGPIEKIFRNLLMIGIPLEIIAVVGRNEGAKHALERIEIPERHNARIFGYTDKIHELMALSDLVVSKPGGLTTSEVLASGAAMAILNPVPGQESRNNDFLLENKAAIKINNIATLAFKITKLLEQEGRLAELKQNARKLGKPRAAFEIGVIAKELITP